MLEPEQILQNEVQEIHEKTKKTILFVTHDVREAVSLGDRVIVLTSQDRQDKAAVYRQPAKTARF